MSSASRGGSRPEVILIPHQEPCDQRVDRRTDHHKYGSGGPRQERDPELAAAVLAMIRQIEQGEAPMVLAGVAVPLPQWSPAFLVQGKFSIEEMLDEALSGSMWLMKKVPTEVRSLFAAALARAYKAAAGGTVRGWALALLFPFLCLQLWPKARMNSPAFHRKLASRLIRFCHGRWRELWYEAVEQRRQNEQMWSKKNEARAPNPGGDVEVTQGRTTRFDSLMRRGEYSKAMKEVMMNGGAYQTNRTPETDQVLEEKLKKGPLPQATEAMHLFIRDMTRRESRVVPTFRVTDVLKELRRRKRGSGPGLSGLTFEHMLNACSAPNMQQSVVMALTQAVNDYAHGEMPLAIAPYVTGGVGGIQGKRRTFVAMESFARLADSLLQRWTVGSAKRNRQPLFKFNLGVGKRAAADLVAAWFRKHRKMFRDVKDLVLIEVDAWNMFFELSRETILKVVLERAPSLYPVVRNYTKPQFIRFFRGLVMEETSKGVPIGSGVSSLIACLVEEVVLQKLHDNEEARKLILALTAYVDNVFFFAKASDVERILEILVRLGRPEGLIYEKRESHPHKVLLVNPANLSRMVLQWKSHFEGYEFAAMLDDPRVPQQELQQGIKLAGVPVGSDCYVREVLEAKVAKARAKLRVLVGEALPPNRRVPKWQAWVLVKMSVVSTLDFLKRVVPPRVSRVILDAFDLEVTEALQGLVGAVGWCQPVPFEGERGCAPAWWQVHAPPSRGGLGVRRLGGGAEIAALVASHFAAFCHFRDELSGSEDFDFIQQINSYNGLVKPKDALKGANWTEVMRALEGRLQRSGGKVQKMLTAAILEKEGDDVWRLLTQAEKRRIAAMSMKSASMWHSMVNYGTVLEPETASLIALTDEQFAYLVRRAVVSRDPHSLGPEEELGLCDNIMQSTGNLCGSPLTLDFVHPETICVKIRGAGKHSSIQNAILKVVREVGLVGSVSYIVDEDGRRIDVLIQGLGSRMSIAVDVANVEINTASRTWVPTSHADTSRVEKNMTAYAAKKVEKYREACVAHHQQFVPFVTDSHGGVEGQADELLYILAQRLADQEMITEQEAYQRVKAVVQASFMRQIAINGLRSLKRVRRRQEAAQLERNARRLEEERRQAVVEAMLERAADMMWSDE